MIQIKNLTKRYGSHTVLENVSMDFSAGHVYGIVGENGVGKTTLFRCIAGLEHYDGDITSDTTPLKNHLGLLLTEPFFLPKMTGEEYIRLLCHARGIRIIDLAHSNLFDLPLHQYATTYSTGMKKKLAITAILLQENKYFILDEPFNGVDIQSNIVLAAVIHRLKALGKVVILSSHIFSTLGDTCDEIHLLRKGEAPKTVLRPDFGALEAEMKAAVVGDKLEHFNLK